MMQLPRQIGLASGLSLWERGLCETVELREHCGNCGEFCGIEALWQL
ncbi:hypothetical protein [Pseudomonas gingeri]